MYLSLNNYIDSLDIDAIPKDRLMLLDKISAYINQEIEDKKGVRLNFICTHNSRRSHLTQIWAHTMVVYYKIGYVKTYSGGTESTAIYDQVINTLINQGFKTEQLSSLPNPIYAIRMGEEEDALIVYSKRYDAFINPSRNFVAVMTCDHVEQNCPYIRGTDKTFSLNYIDPKISDDSKDKEKVYLDRSEQIATELKYLFSQLN